MRSLKGISISALKKKTGSEDGIIYNTVYKLLRQGKIVRLERGVYKKRLEHLKYQSVLSIIPFAGVISFLSTLSNVKGTDTSFIPSFFWTAK